MQPFKSALQALGYRREDLATYRNLFLITVGGFALIYSIVFLDEWFRGHSRFDLYVSAGTAALALICGMLPRNRRELMAGEVGLVFVLGIVGTIVTRRWEAVPIVLIAAIMLWLLTRRGSGARVLRQTKR